MVFATAGKTGRITNAGLENLRTRATSSGRMSCSENHWRSGVPRAGAPLGRPRAHSLRSIVLRPSRQLQGIPETLKASAACRPCAALRCAKKRGPARWNLQRASGKYPRTPYPFLRKTWPPCSTKWREHWSWYLSQGFHQSSQARSASWAQPVSQKRPLAKFGEGRALMTTSLAPFVVVWGASVDVPSPS